MAESAWQRRIARAKELGSQYTFAEEVLRFYVAIAQFQKSLYEEFGRSNSGPLATSSKAFAGPLPSGLADRFGQFLSVVEQSGTPSLRDAARDLPSGDKEAPSKLLSIFWEENGTAPFPPGPGDFFARAFLQPYAEYVRSHSSLRWTGPAPYICPHCKRKPGLGVLRPLGDGGQRSLMCSFCLAEWEFRRIVCPGCGEEDPTKLPVYTAEEVPHVRVEPCDSCRTYIKTVDMTKSGRAEPVVDEMASIPLDLWAAKQGYTKLQSNLLQL